MKKKVFSKLLMVALVATVGVFSSCKDYDDDISDVRNQITTTKTQLQQDFDSKIATANSAIAGLTQSVANLEEANKAAKLQIETLQSTLDSKFTDAKAYSDANLGKALTAAQAAQDAAEDFAAQQAAVAQQAAISAAADALAKAKEELTAALTKANETIATQGTTIENLIKEDAKLTAAISAATARANEAYALADKANTLAEQNKAAVEKAAAEIATLQTSLANLQGTAANKADVAKLQSDLAALQKQVNENVVNLADYNTSLTQTTSDLAKLKENLNKEVDNLTKSIAAVKATADGNVTKIESINQQLVALQEADKALETKIVNSVNSLNALIEKTQGDAAAALKAAVEGQEAKLAAVKTLVENNDAAIRALLEAKASELNKLIEGNTDLIKKNAENIEKNAEAQKAENIIMKNGIAKNAQDIIAQGKDITNLKDVVAALQTALGKETAATLKAYAESVAKTAADKALLDAKGYADAQDAAQNITIMDAIAAQAKQDKDAWESAIKTAVDGLIKTYQLNALAETIKNAQLDAEANAKSYTDTKAQELSDKALADAKHYTDDLKTFLTTNYTNTEGMTAAIEAAKQAAVAQAYKNVMDALLADNTDWTKNGKVITIAEEVRNQLKAFAEAAGYTNAEAAQKIAEDAIAAALIKSEPEAMGKPEVKAGPIMAEIEAAAKVAADELYNVNQALDGRLDAIEGFLGNTLGDGEAFKASVNALIAAAKLAKAADVEKLQKQFSGEEGSVLKTALDAVVAQASQNAKDVQKVQTTINNINGMFSTLFGKADVESNVDEDALKLFEDNIQSLVTAINTINSTLETFDEKVMESVNKNLGPNIQQMITAIHLFANQHMAHNDQYGQIKKTTDYDGKITYSYPAGYDNFDHELTFVYAIEQGLDYDYCEDMKKIAADPNYEPKAKTPSWNYPDGLLSQLKDIKTSRDLLTNDYDFSYDKGGFTGSETAYDFVEGRFNSHEDSILVRVSPTNADLRKADIALLNSLGDDLVDAGLIELVEVKKYDRLLVAEATRAAAGNETGLWVIKFKLNDNDPELMDKFNKAAYTNDGDILYAVAVKNTNFSADAEAESDGIDRYVVSEYDLNLGLTPSKRANEFFVNTVSINDIHNRYIQPEQAKIGTSKWDDDPFFMTGSFRYELTWTDLACPAFEVPEPTDTEAPAAANPIMRSWYNFCCGCFLPTTTDLDDDCYEWTYGRDQRPVRGGFKGLNEAGFTTIVFDEANDSYATGKKDDAIEKGNTVDRLGHTISEMGKRKVTGFDNRHLKEPLPIVFKVKGKEGVASDFPADAKDGEGWAKITIDFPDINKCGENTTIRGFFVTLDNHFALESDNSEINSWATYEFRNVALYNYDHSKKEVDPEVLRDIKVTLQKGNHGEIFIKDARNLNDGDVVGFRVHAVNLDGTFTDPDGRAFYVVIGKQNTKHNLSFQVVTESNDKYAEAVQDLENGKNPIAQYNKDQVAAKSDDRFFNQEPYYPSYYPAETFRAIYIWRDNAQGKPNPAIRYAGNSTDAMYPISGTGNNWTDEEGDEYAKFTYNNSTNVQNGSQLCAPELFFEFYYSPNENADIEAKTGDVDNMWTPFGTYYDNGKRRAPNKETLSMKARIKAGMANRLVDNATYTITMLIQRNDGQTGWTTVNTYDIDIKKVMPTGMPEKFHVKSNQLKDGKWNIYLRPYQGADGSGNYSENNAWKISWSKYADKWLAGAADAAAKQTAFADGFNKDLNKNTDPESVVAKSFHNQRWGVDARPYNFEEMFTGLFVEKFNETTGETENTSEWDKDYYFVFDQSGDYNAADAETDKVKGDTEQAKSRAITVFDPNPTIQYTQDGLQHKATAGYYLPKIHWSNLDQDRKVYAGYIYRNISATIDEKTNKFLDPNGNKEDFIGLPVKNADLPIEAVAVKVGTADLKVSYKCAFFGAGVKEWAWNGKDVKNEFDYNSPVSVGTTAALFTLTSTQWEDGAKNDGKVIQAYFNSKLEQLGLKAPKKANNSAASAVGDIANGKTLAEMLANKWIWIDRSSLAVSFSAPSGYVWKDYFYAPYFAKDGGAPLTADDDPSAIVSIEMKPIGGTTGNPDFKEAPVGKFTFDIYDAWFHKRTLEVSFKINKPEATTGARQAR